VKNTEEEKSSLRKMISSSQNQRVKEVVHLRRRRERDKQNRMLIEGYRQLLRAYENDYPVDELFICRDLFQGPNEEFLIEGFSARGTSIIETAETPFCRMAYRDRPEGLLGVAPQVRKGLGDLQYDNAPFFLVAESIEKPGNLGTILRSVDAAGADGVIMCDSCTDLYNPNVVRASVGTLFTVQVAESTTDETVEWMRENGVVPVLASPHAEVFYTEVDLTRPVAFVVGTEQYGLSEKWMRQEGIRCRIPMHGQADSLNVASTVTLLLYETVRQRQMSGPPA